jgi:hypothetical protein
MYGLTLKNKLSIIEPYCFKINLNIVNAADTLRGFSGSPAFSDSNIVAILNGGLHKEEWHTGKIITFNLVNDLDIWR